MIQLINEMCSQGLDAGVEVDEDTSVNFAYSVTALHHCCVVECVVADVPACLAYNISPTFVMHGGKHRHQFTVFLSYTLFFILKFIV